MFKIFSKWWEKYQDKKNEKVCFGCRRIGDKRKMKRFIFAEDAFGPMGVEWYHLKCYEHMTLCSLAVGHEPHMGHFDLGGNLHKSPKVSKEGSEWAKKELEKMGYK